MEQTKSTDDPLYQWQEAIWLLIPLLIPLFVNFWVEQQFEASKIWLFRVFVGVLSILWVAGWLGGFRQKKIPTTIRNLVLALFLLISLSTILSPDKSISIFGSLDRANGLLTQISYLLLFYFVATQIGPESSRRMLAVITLTAVPICFLGLAQTSGWQPLPVLTDARSLITTTLGRANFTGAYLALLLPLTLAAFQASGSIKWRRLGFGALFGMEIIVITLTEARAAWIAAISGIGLHLWLYYSLHWSQRIRRLSLLGGSTALAGLLILILQRGLAGGSSIAARWTIWQASLRLLWPRLWLGYGGDTLELHFPAVYPPELVYYQGRGVVVDRAHNWLLDWSLNYGIVATLVLLTLSLFILWQGWKYIQASHIAGNKNLTEETLGSNWMAACMAAAGGYLIGNLFLFEVVSTAVVFWLLLAIITATITKHYTQYNPSSGPPWLRRGAVVMTTLFVGWLVWLGSVSPLLADIHSWRGTKALNSGNPAAALAEYETAVNYQPQQTAYLIAYALTAAQLNNFEQAEIGINEALSLRPNDPVTVSQLAAIYAHKALALQEPDLIELAYDAYEHAITLAPTIALTYQQYADLALRSGDSDIALVQAKQAVNLDATDGISFGILGWAQLQAGDLPAAQNAFGQALRWQPDSADFHLGLATVYFQQGSFEAARLALEQSLIHDPLYPPALTLQVALQDK